MPIDAVAFARLRAVEGFSVAGRLPGGWRSLTCGCRLSVVGCRLSVVGCRSRDAGRGQVAGLPGGR
jgi:hypothetical protein